jgi:hypothetical protein
MDEQSFRELLLCLATAWNKADTDTALACFSIDGIYMQPPSIHIFEGYSQLKVLFSTLQPGNNFIWHSIWFDKKTQTGAGEYTFKIHETHGVAIIKLNNYKIQLWREYQWHGNLSWEKFISTDSKSFGMTINNFKY